MRYCKLHSLPHFWLPCWSWVFETAPSEQFFCVFYHVYSHHPLLWLQWESKGFLFKHSKRWQNKCSFLSNCTCFWKTGKIWITALSYHSPPSLAFLLPQPVLQNHPLPTGMASVKLYKYLFHGYLCCYYKWVYTQCYLQAFKSASALVFKFVSGLHLVVTTECAEQPQNVQTSFLLDEI